MFVTTTFFLEKTHSNFGYWCFCQKKLGKPSELKITWTWQNDGIDYDNEDLFSFAKTTTWWDTRHQIPLQLSHKTKKRLYFLFSIALQLKKDNTNRFFCTTLILLLIHPFCPYLPEPLSHPIKRPRLLGTKRFWHCNQSPAITTHGLVYEICTWS